MGRRPQSAVTNRRPALDRAGAQTSILSNEYVATRRFYGEPIIPWSIARRFDADLRTDVR
jgi:hypothetical protein